MKKNHQFFSLCAALFLLLCSCSKSDYTKALPTASTALMYVDVSKTGGVGNSDLLRLLLPSDSIGDCGLDFSQKIYLFELPDGQCGACIRVGDADQVGETLKKLEENDHCKGFVHEGGGVKTAILRDSWVVAYDDDAFLMLFSVAATDVQQAKSRLARYLRQDGERSEKFTRLFQKLNTMKSSAAAVGRGQTLLKTTDFDLPKNIDAKQVQDAIVITVEDSVAYARIQRFSFDEKVEKALKEHESVLRPIQGRYAQMLPADNFFNIIFNTDGEKFLSEIQDMDFFKPLLASANAALDVNNIIKSIDGEVVISYFGDIVSLNGSQFSLIAELSHSQWLKDVGYWKTSCPKGSEIKDWGKDSYCYINGKELFYFGVVSEQKNASSQQFYCGNTPEVADSPLQSVAKPISGEITERLKGNRFALVMNLNRGTLFGESSRALLKPFATDANALVYILE